MQNGNAISQQLYPLHEFQLPSIGEIELEPFKDPVFTTKVLPNPDHLDVSEIPPCYALTQDEKFNNFLKEEKIQPLLIDITEKYLHICSSDCLISCSLNELEKYEKAGLPQKPTAMKTSQELVYLGCQSGKVILYSLITKNIQAISEDFDFPVIQLILLEDHKVVGLDTVGNVRMLTFSYKYLLEKMVRVSIHSKDFVITVKQKKRQKLKKMFQKVPFFKKSQQAQEVKTSQSENLHDETESHRISILPQDLWQDQIKIVPLAIFYKNKIKIIFVNSQSFEIVSEQELLDEVPEIGIMEFGRGGFIHSNQSHTLFIVSIDKTLICFRQVLMEDTIQYLKIFQFPHTHKILSGKFISNNLIIYYTEKGLELSNVNSPLLLLQSFHEQHMGNLCVAQNNFSCFFKNNIVFGKIQKWSSYLNKLADEFQWQKCMKCALMIYQGEIKILAGINENLQKRNEQMKSLFEKITLTFLAFELKKQNPSQQLILKQAIDFMVRTQSFSYLFTTIFQAIKNLNLLPKFITQLQTYIQSSLIPFMTEQILDLVLKYCLSEEKVKLLQILIISFDLTMMEPAYLLTICLNHELYYPLVQICKKQKDFVTPLIKLCGLRIIKQNQEQTIQKKQECNKICSIIFWYIRECLVGHMTEYGDDEGYLGMLDQLINFMFIPSSLQMLFKISSEFLMKSINMFFEAKTMKYILQNASRFFIKKNSFIDKTIFKKYSIEEFKVYQKMLATLIFTIKQEDYELYKFLTYLMLKNSMPFSTQYKVKSFKFFVRHPLLFEDDKVEEIDEDQQIKINAYLRRMLDSILRDIQTEQIQKLMNDLLGTISLSPYHGILGEGKCYVLHELGNSADALETYINMKNKKIQKKVFLFCRENLLNPIKNWNSLFYKFIENIDFFLKEDQSTTLELLMKSLERNPDISAIDFALEKVKDVDLQLALIQKIVNLVTIGRQKLIMRHLHIVIQKKKEKLEEYILKMDYPLEECYSICQQHQHKSGMAYILIKSGRNQEGIKILIDIFIKSTTQGLKSLAKNHQYEGYHKAKEQLIKIFTTCESQYQIDSSKGQEIWELTIQSIFKGLNLKGVNLQKLPKKQIKQILWEIVELLVSSVFKCVSTQFYIKFCTNFSYLPTLFYVKAFFSIRDRIQFQYNLQFLASELEGIYSSKLYHQVLLKERKGLMCRSSECTTCMGDHEEQTVVLYPCSHLFHYNCLQTPYCPQCQNQWEIMLKKEDKLEYERYHVISEKEDEEIKLKRSKLKEFDQIMEKSFEVYTKFD